jgi:DNA-binding NarL/FixJ family response regulator
MSTSAIDSSHKVDRRVVVDRRRTGVLTEDLCSLVAGLKALAHALGRSRTDLPQRERLIDLIVVECDRVEALLLPAITTATRREESKPTSTDAFEHPMVAARIHPMFRVVVVGDSYEQIDAVRHALEAEAIEHEIHCPHLLNLIVEKANSRTVCFLMRSEHLDLVGEVERVRRMNPQLPILVIWEHPDSTDFMGLVTAGAMGCISIDRIVRPNRLSELIQAAADGQAIVPREFVRLLIEDVWQRSCRERLATFRLTHREEEILVLLMEGMTTNEMAARFYVSAVTIRTHLSAIYRKIGVSDRSSALELLGRVAPN